MSTGNKYLKDLSKVTPDLMSSLSDLYDVQVPNSSTIIE